MTSAMGGHAGWFTIVLLFASSTLGAAQGPAFQLGGGGGIGAQYSSGSTDNGLFPAVALGIGFTWPKLFVRADARAFATEAEALVTVGVAAGVPLLRAESTHLYVLGTAGTGLFVAEGDPGHHVGTGIGLRTGLPVGVYAELRYDYLVGTFIYAARQRNLASLIAGVRVGPRGL